MNGIVVLCTVPNATLADAIAQTVVGERLAACVNRIPGLISTYRWQGAICRDEEYLLLIKTDAASFETLRRRIRDLHEYTVPEIIALPIVAGDYDYLAWIEASLKNG